MIWNKKKTGENNLDCAKIFNHGKKIVNTLCSYISSNNKESRNNKEGKKRFFFFSWTAQGFQTNLPFGKYDKAAFIFGISASWGSCQCCVVIRKRNRHQTPRRLSAMFLRIHNQSFLKVKEPVLMYSRGSQFSVKKAKELPMEPPVLYWWFHENCQFFEGWEITRTSNSLNLIFFQKTNHRYLILKYR